MFRYTFTEDLDVIGYSSLRLFLEGKDCEDMDLFAEIGKEAPGGGFLDWECTPPNRYMGPFPAYECRLRLSMRALDPGKSVENIPVQSFAKPEPVRAGEIAEADLAIRPMGVRFHAGETLLLRIGNEFASFLKQGRQIGKANTGGTHILHTGEGHPSCLVLPVRRVG